MINMRDYLVKVSSNRFRELLSLHLHNLLHSISVRDFDGYDYHYGFVSGLALFTDLEVMEYAPAFGFDLSPNLESYRLVISDMTDCQPAFNLINCSFSFDGTPAISIASCSDFEQHYDSSFPAVFSSHLELYCYRLLEGLCSDDDTTLFSSSLGAINALLSFTSLSFHESCPAYVDGAANRSHYGFVIVDAFAPNTALVHGCLKAGHIPYLSSR